jgi:hypothetical protein
MKLTFLPTLTDLREMLGDRLYVEFVWMWREQEQASRSQERRARWADQVPVRSAEEWPQPLFTRVEPLEEPVTAMPAQVALLHPSLQRLLEQRVVNGPDRKIGQAVQDDEPELAASRARSEALRSAAE